MSRDLTVALFGGCATHMAGEKYRHTRAVGLTNWLSIISPTTENFKQLTKEKLEETSMRGYFKRICLLNSNKKFLDYLLEEKADFLILDANDCRKQLVLDKSAPEGTRACIMDNRCMPDFDKCMSFMFASGEGYEYVPGTSIDRAEYEHAVEVICGEIKKVYRPEQIILNKHYYAESYIDDRGIHKYVRLLPDETDKALELIKYIESLLEKHLAGCHIIDFPDDVLGDPNHRFGLCSMHYHPMYYEYAQEALEVIFRGAAEERFMLKQLRCSYSMRFKLMKMEKLAETRNKIMERETDNIACLGSWGNSPDRSEDLTMILRSQESICEYLDALYMLRDKIIVFMAVRDTPGFYEDSIILRKLKRLGFTDFQNKLWWMYAGIIFRGMSLINRAADAPEMSVEVEQLLGGMTIYLVSKSWRAGDQAVIEVNGSNWAPNRRGINLVVCCAADGKIVDRVSYDSHLMDFFSR